MNASTSDCVNSTGTWLQQELCQRDQLRSAALIRNFQIAAELSRRRRRERAAPFPGDRVREAMSGVPGVADLSLEQQVDVPVVRFVLNRPAIALRADDIAEAVETSFSGATVGRIFVIAF
jgi:hypothetical protein